MFRTSSVIDHRRSIERAPKDEMRGLGMKGGLSTRRWSPQAENPRSRSDHSLATVPSWRREHEMIVQGCVETGYRKNVMMSLNEVKLDHVLEYKGSIRPRLVLHPVTARDDLDR